MTRRILIERAAELDMAEITIVLRERHPASATKFVKAARAAFRLLATQPEMGRRYQTPHPFYRIYGFGKSRDLRNILSSTVRPAPRYISSASCMVDEISSMR